MPPGEETLVESLRAGDGHAFAQIVRSHHACVRGFARAFLADSEEGDDVAQDTFRDLWIDRGALRVAGSLRAHLLARARNLCLMRCRTRSRARGWLRLFEEEPRDPVALPSDPMDAGEEAFSHQRTVGTLAASIRQLSEEVRTVIYMRFWGGASFEDISAALGRPPHACRAMLYRQLALLRELLGDES